MTLAGVERFGYSPCSRYQHFVAAGCAVLPHRLAFAMHGMALRIMANFHTHVTFSSVLGCGYAAVGCATGIPLDTALVGGGLCGLSGMLPDLDSDSGIPLRESMAFAAAVVPMFLLDRLRSLELQHDTIVFSAAVLYFFVRFGVAKMIARRTTHRGMFHSVPAALIFAGAAFLLCSSSNVNMRYFKAGGVLLGVMSHLLLDEIYSIEWKGGRWRLKRSFGTAIKFWSNDLYSNFSTYAKLVVIVTLIVGEPAVMEWLEGRSPTLADSFRRIQQRFSVSRELIEDRAAGFNRANTARVGESREAASYSTGTSAQPDNGFQTGVNYFEASRTATTSPPDTPQTDHTIYDTARRIYQRFTQSGDDVR